MNLFATSHASSSESLMPVAERPLTVIERVLHAVQQLRDGDGMPIFAARCSGPWDEEKFKAALAAVQRRHPLLRARIVSPKPHWPQFQFFDEAPPIPLEVLPGSPTNRWDRIALRESQRRFDPEVAPLTRFTVLPAADDRGFDVIAPFHHAVIDGKSILTLFHELFSHMAGHTWDDHVCAAETVFRPMKRPAWWRLVRQAGKLIEMQVRQQIMPSALVPDEIPFPGACLRLIGPATLMPSLVANCRQQGTSVYGALAAATLQTVAEHEHWRNVNLQLMVPFDIRADYEQPVDEETIGCFAGILDFWQKRPGKMAFWELARNCRQQVDHERSWWMPNCWDKLMSGVAFTPAWLKPLRRMAVGINNLGSCRRIAAGPYQLEELSWFARSQHLGGTVTINTATIEGRLNLTVQGSRLTRETLMEIGEAILRRLEQAAGLWTAAPQRQAA